MSFNGKIVILTPGFPKDETDYNCLPYLQDLILLLTNRLENDQIEIVSFQYPFVRKTYLWNNIRVHAIGGKNKKRLFKLVTWVRVLMCLKRIHSRRKIDVLHAFWLNDTALIAQLFGFLFNINSLVTIMGQDPLKSNKYLKLINLKKLTLIGLSNFVSGQLQKSSGRQTDDIIPLVCRKEEFKNLPETGQSFDVLGVGNLYPLKNYSLFIEVVEILIKDFPELRCAIAGSGIQLDELLNLTTQKKLNKNLVFLGETLRNKVLSIMKNSAVLLHTSQYESQGFAMSEALYLGMKVVSTPVSDTESNDNIQCGRTPEELAACVRLALGNSNRDCIVQYSPEKAIDKYLHHYLALSN